MLIRVTTLFVILKLKLRAYQVTKLHIHSDFQILLNDIRLLFVIRNDANQ